MLGYLDMVITVDMLKTIFSVKILGRLHQHVDILSQNYVFVPGTHGKCLT